MNQVIDFIRRLTDTSDWPPRWHCGRWSDFHGWLYITSDLLVWLAYYTIPFIIVKYISRKSEARFIRLYFLFAAFIVACGTTHLIDAIMFWYPAYRINALMRLITAVVSWTTVYHIVKYLPLAFAQKTTVQLENEITEQQQEMAVMEKRYRSIIEQSSEAIILIDGEYNVIYTNQTARKLIAAPYSNAMHWADLVHPEELIALREAMQVARSHTGGTVNVGFRMKNEYGHYRNMEGHMQNMLHDATLSAIIIHLRDVTDKQESERQKALYEAIINSSDDAIISERLDGTIMSWNPGAEYIFGYTAAEAEGSNISMLIPLEHRHEEVSILQRIRTGEYVRHYETRRIKKDGQYVYVSLSLSPIRDGAGNIIGASKISRDITEQTLNREKIKQNEEVYRKIATSMQGIVLTLTDDTHRYLLADGGGLPSMGLSKESMEGKLDSEALSPEAYPQIHPYRERALKGEVCTTEWEVNGLTFMMRFVPLHNEDNEVYSVLTVSQDITEMKNAAKEIQALNESLERKVKDRTRELEIANKELEAFCYSVSHDLRAPLRVINGYADILITDYNGKLDAEGRHITEVILTNTKQMGKLIDELLNLSRLGRKQLNIRTTDMRQLAQLAIDNSRIFDHKFEYHLAELANVPCDGALMMHVWNNLISNAVKYSSKQEHPIVEIHSEKNDSFAIFSVKDNGVGFDMKYSDKLFGVFQRLHKRTEFEGTGIGLALVQRIVHRHGGDVWARSAPNEGATFYFSLPLTANENHDDDREPN